MAMTFKEVIEKIGEREFRVELDNGQWLAVSCWTDDEEVLAWPATFSVSTSWGEIGQYDNLHGELDAALYGLIKQLEMALPGTTWRYDAPNASMEQPE